MIELSFSVVYVQCVLAFVAGMGMVFDLEEDRFPWLVILMCVCSWALGRFV